MALAKISKPKAPSLKGSRATGRPSLAYGVRRGAQTDYTTLGARPLAAAPAGVSRGGSVQLKLPSAWKNIISQGAFGGTQGGMQGGGPTGGGGLIGGDWEVQAAEAAMASGMARARGDFQSGLRQALIDLGIGDTTKLGNLSKYIDADTITAAVANKYSQNAKIGQQAERVTAQTRARNAAMGRLSSGETTNRETEIAAQAEGNRYQALRDFLSGGSEGLMGLADLEGKYAEQIASARAAAAMRAAETYPGAFAGDEGALPVAGTPSGLSNSSVKTIPGGRLGSYRAPLRSGWRYGVGGQYMTANQFNQQRPQGSYSAYLNYLKRARGGKL